MARVESRIGQFHPVNYLHPYLPSIETTHTSKLNEAERIKTDIDTYIYPSISYSVNFLVHVLIILLHVRFVISNEAIIRKVLLVLICEDFLVLVS